MKSTSTSLLIIFLFLFSLPSTGQILPIDSTTGKITYTAVIQVDSVTKDQLYSRALEWFATTFKSAKAAIDLSDRQAGLIKADNDINITAYRTRGNGNTMVAGAIMFSLQIYCKEGRFKYIITDLRHEKIRDKDAASCSVGALEKPKENMCMWNKDWQSLKAHADEDMKKLILSLEQSMTKSSKGSLNNEDW